MTVQKNEKNKVHITRPQPAKQHPTTKGPQSNDHNHNWNYRKNTFEKSYEINNDYSSALVSSIFHKLKLSDWSSLSNFSNKKNSIGIEGEAVMPFYTLVMEDNPKNQMLRSVNYSNQNLKKFNNNDLNLKIYKNKKIKVGYYSSDFFDHATMFLISGLLREHNKEES